MSAKYEKLIDLIVNEEQDKARALFHEIVVEQSRKIYENLVNEENPEQEMQEGETDDFVNDVSDHEDSIEGDEEGIEVSDDEFGSDEEFGGNDMGSEEGEGGIEDRVMDLESAIDELKAEFDQLMAGEEGEFGSEGEGEFGSEEGMGDEFAGDGEIEGSEFDQDEDNGDMEESMVREYVEKVGKDWPNGESEGSEVGASSKKININKKSNFAGKNDMGGSNKNIARGGSNEVPTGPKAPSNEYTKGEGKLIGKVENSPGARAGQTFSQGPKAKTSQATGVNTKSTLPK